MAPPKIKLHKNTGKLKSIPRPSSIPSSTAAQATAGPAASAGNGSDASEADRQFELELYWCIQQLETTLNLPTVRENNKKLEETSKLINTLKSGTQPIIRKRQIMRTTFGDYRSKMAAEEQTMAVNPNSVRFEKAKELTTSKHTFVKKSAVLTGDKNFKFNFTVDPNEPADQQPEAAPSGLDGKKKDAKPVQKTNVGLIVPSDNAFRFNFSVSSE